MRSATFARLILWEMVKGVLRIQDLDKPVDAACVVSYGSAIWNS